MALEVYFTDEMARTLALLAELNNRQKESNPPEYTQGYHQALVDFGAAYGLVEVSTVFLPTKRELST